MKCIVILLISLLLSSCGDSNAPKPNDMRVVQEYGTYAIQYYWNRPGWQYFTTETFKTKEEAVNLVRYIKNPSSNVVYEHKGNQMDHIDVLKGKGK